MFRLGLIVAVLVLVADQLSKIYFLDLMQQNPAGLPVLPFFNLVMVWNTGVSFGLFQEDSALRSWTLIGVAVAVMVWLLVWLWRAEQRLVGLALGSIIGGAIGNIIDRVRFGAVFDFLDFHAFGWHWPAFNVADSAIVIGVLLLLLDGSCRIQMAAPINRWGNLRHYFKYMLPRFVAPPLE